MAKDVLPKSVNGLGDLGKVWGRGGERGDDEILDVVEVVFDLLDGGQYDGHGGEG